MLSDSDTNAAGTHQLPAFVEVQQPSGNSARVPIAPLPFTMGRQPDNSLVLRDSRVSRRHAQIVLDGEEYYVEDLGSSHGTFLNGERVQRKPLLHGDVIEFGVPNSYRVVFVRGIAMATVVPSEGAANLCKLRSLLEVARSMAHSLSPAEVLSAIVESALSITGCERGYLFLCEKEDLRLEVGKNRLGQPLDVESLGLETRVLRIALDQRHDLLSFTVAPQVAAVPLIRVRSGSINSTRAISAAKDTVGLLYLIEDSGAAADLSSGNRELLETLALEASAVLENARLLEQERAKQRLDEELGIARKIQADLLPKSLPVDGWFRASGWTIPSLAVGGDYFDVARGHHDQWALVMADVSGKGVSAALLAALLQGAFLQSKAGHDHISAWFASLNRFLLDRTGGEKYATIFYASVHQTGAVDWVNAGHCSPMIVRVGGAVELLGPSGMPVGMLEEALHGLERAHLNPGEKIVLYTDGLSEARNPEGEFYDTRRLRQFLEANHQHDAAELARRLREEAMKYMGGAQQQDDVTVLVVEFV